MYSIETFLICDLVKMFFFHFSNIFRKKDFRLTCASFAEITVSAASLCSKNFVSRDWGIGEIFISGIGDFFKSFIPRIGDFLKSWDIYPGDSGSFRDFLFSGFFGDRDFSGMGIFFVGSQKNATSALTGFSGWKNPKVKNFRPSWPGIMSNLCLSSFR